MSDIRKYAKKPAKTTTKRSRVIHDDDDDDVYEEPKASKPPGLPIEDQVDSSQYFGDVKIQRTAARSSKSRPKVKGEPAEDELEGLDDDEMMSLVVEDEVKALPENKGHKRSASKQEYEASPSKKRKPPPTNVVKSEANTDGPAVNTILEAVPTIDLPETGPPATFKFGQPAASALAPGSKEIPEGADGCLSGLTFVFTGVLQSLERTEAQDLVKRYGARVTTAPSKMTSFVVIGSDAGPSKIDKIKKLGVKSIDEDGLLQLIRTMPAHGGDSSSAKKAVEKREAEDKAAKKQAATMAADEQREKKENEAKLRKAAEAGQRIKVFSANEKLWTTKYAPTSMKDIIGNKGNVEKLTRFLNDWPKNLKASFKKPGPDGMGLFRAVLLSGSPGIGKTTSAHLVAGLAGFDVLEFNASDTRSKRLLEEGLKGVVNNNSLNGYFAGEGQVADHGKRRLVLIMDEVDGMSAGDRGGVGALNTVIRQTTIPIICICNDRSSQKLKPLEKTTYDLKFTKPTKDQIRSRIMSIAYKEKLSLQPLALDQLVEGSGSDIRQILNLLSTYKLTSMAMSQEEGKEGSKAAQKHVILKPWDIVGKLLSGATYHELSKVTLNEKIELYFNDHEMSYLMVQENYLGTTPDRVRSLPTDQARKRKHLQLCSKAAAAISDGDLVDAMIHGPQQHWSLMPTHAVFSCVRPGSLIAGPTGRTNFTAVLGNMSKTNKGYRMLRELRSHLLLKTSGDRLELRRDYIPILFERIPKLLSSQGADAIAPVIDMMDQYFLNREDYDSLLELGVGKNNRKDYDASVPSTVKSSFTRQYNSASHPVAFIAGSAPGPTKKIAASAMPDIEDAVDVSEEEIDVKEEAAQDDEALDLKTDKLISAPKKRAVKGSASGPSKAKKAPAKKKVK